jgi:hypothetical protein
VLKLQNLTWFNEDDYNLPLAADGLLSNALLHDGIGIWS